MFSEVSLVDSFDIDPIVFYSQFLKLGLVLIMPSPESSPLFFGKGSSAGNVVFPSVSHFNVLGDEVLVGYLCVSFDNCELLLVFPERDR